VVRLSSSPILVKHSTNRFLNRPMFPEWYCNSYKTCWLWWCTVSISCWIGISCTRRHVTFVWRVYITTDSRTAGIPRPGSLASICRWFHVSGWSGRVPWRCTPFASVHWLQNKSQSLHLILLYPGGRAYLDHSWVAGMIQFPLKWRPSSRRRTGKPRVERRGRMARTSDSQPEGRGFESGRRHGVVSVSRIP
jgi:hypothetical protein